MFVDVSARANTNIEQLLEAILLTADAALDLRANPNMEAQGVAIEAHLDRGRGPVATVLVAARHAAGGRLGGGRRWPPAGSGGCSTSTAGTSPRRCPSQPVQVIGFTSVPGAGDTFLVVDEDRVARQIADRRRARDRNAELASRRKRVSLEDLDAALKETDSLNLIIKGDNSGTVEALEDALMKIDVRRGCRAAVDTPGRRWHHRERHQPRHRVRRRGAGSTSGPRGKATELANREGCGAPLLLGDLARRSTRSKRPLKACSSRSTKRSSSAAPRSARCSAPPRSEPSPAAWCSPGRIRLNARARLLRDNVVVVETSRSARCGGSRTTRSRSARASSVV